MSRRFFPEMESPTKQYLNTYFPDNANNVWEESKKPFAGYAGTYIGSVAHRRLKKAKQLGLKKRGWYKKKFLGSDVLFISSHHWAAYPEEGGPGAIGPAGKPRLIEFRKERFVAPRVKLIMISSCRGLDPEPLKLWKKRFPNAYILGWRGSSPETEEQKGIEGRPGLMRQFLMKLPEDLILEKTSDIQKILKSWEEYIQKLATTPKAVKPKGLGYATPQGAVKWYAKSRTGWEWKTR